MAPDLLGVNCTRTSDYTLSIYPLDRLPYMICAERALKDTNPFIIVSGD